jgi:hypothetical protein
VTSLTLPVLFTPLNAGDDPADDSIPAVMALADSTWPSGLPMGGARYAAGGHLPQRFGAARSLYRLGRDRGIVFALPACPGTFVVTDLSGTVVHCLATAGRDRYVRWTPKVQGLSPGTYLYRFVATSGGVGSCTGRLVLLP